jgi:tetratricopeptide (TPR) repeat protein
VTERRFDVVALSGLDRFEADFDTIPVRIPLGIEAFGVNAYAAREAGGRVIEERDAPAGTLVFVRDPAVRRGAVAREPETTVLVVGGTRGRAFEPSPWESWLEALPAYRARDFEEAGAILARWLERHPDNPSVLYNLACCEALTGRREEALAHLARAAEGDERVAGWAAGDEDLESLRDDPAFPR